MEIRGSSVAVHRARNECVMERWSGDATKVPLFADLGLKPESNDPARHGGDGSQTECNSVWEKSTLWIIEMMKGNLDILILIHRLFCRFK